METKHLNQIQSLKAALDANGGIVPDAWLPYIELLVLGLKLAKIFTNDKIDAIIDEILAAIALLNNA